MRQMEVPLPGLLLISKTPPIFSKRYRMFSSPGLVLALAVESPRSFDSEVFTWKGLPTIESLHDPARNTMLAEN